MLDDSERATAPGRPSAAKAGAAATVTGVLDDSERAPRGGSAEAGAAAASAPPAGSAGAGATTKGVRDDGEHAPSGAGEPSAMSREMVAKGGASRTVSQKYSGEQIGQPGGSRDDQRDNVGSRGCSLCGTNYCTGYQRRRDQLRARRAQGVDGKGSSGGAWDGVAARPVTELAALGQIRKGKTKAGGESLEMLAHIVPSARRAMHRCKESRRWKESRHHQNRCRYRTPARAQAC